MSPSSLRSDQKRLSAATRPPAPRPALVAALAAALLAAACGIDTGGSGGGGKACTLIGCIDMLTIQAKTPQGSVIAYVQGHLVVDGVSVQVSCLGTNKSGTAGVAAGVTVFCTDQGLQVQGAPAKVVATLSSGDYAVTDEVIEPTYTTSQPNGPGCDPICKQATVSVTLGGGLVDVIDDAGDASSGDSGTDDTGASADADASGDDADASGEEVDVAADTAVDAGTDAIADTAPDADPDAAPDTEPDAGKGCCQGPEDCVTGHCISGVCYETTTLKPGTCWKDEDCGSTEICQGPITCPCGALCIVADKPGTCAPKPQGGACCDVNTACGPGMVCAKTTCKVTKDLGANQCWTDAQCLEGELCSGAVVCSCLAMCPAADAPGVCKLPPKTCVPAKNGDFGMCDMVMGWAFDGSKCVTLSGCGCKESCAGVYASQAECEAACP